MKKYLKYIIIIILIVLILGSLLLFFNYSEQGNKAENTGGEKNDINNKMYAKNWYISKLTVYTEEEGIVSDSKLEGSNYMYLTRDEISFCVINDDCTQYYYTYKDGKITMPTDDLVTKGEYDVKIDGDVMELSQTLEKATLVYTFEARNE